MGNGSVSARVLVTVVWTLALVGCSASDYSKPIATFADATTTADAALRDLNKAATDRYTALLSRRAIANKRSLLLARKDGGKTDCGIGSARCRIVLIEDANRRENGLALVPDPPLDNMVAVMGDVNAYARNLAALVADDSAAQAATHVNAALGSVESLANTVADAGGKAKGSVPNFATPVGAAVNWLLGKYADRVKLEGLRTATKEADPVIQSAAALFQDAALVGADFQSSALTASFQTSIDAFTEDRNSANLDAAIVAAKTFDDFLRSAPGATFKEMGKAHAALTNALHNPDASWPQVFAQIQSFAAQAEQLAKIVRDLAALTQKK
jgi:hypothetical protein